MNRHISRLSLFLLGIGLSISAYSQNTGIFTIQTGVPTLLINSNIQSAGMGEISVVSSPAYYSAGLTYNPALLSRNATAYGAQVSLFPWLRATGAKNVSVRSLGFHLSLGDKHSLGYYGQIFRIGKETGIVEFSNLPSPATESRHGLRYATSISENLSLGIGLNYIQTHLITFSYEGKSAKAFGGDLGLIYHNSIRPNNRTKLTYDAGFSIQHLGPKITQGILPRVEEFLPTNMQLGFLIGNHQSLSHKNVLVFELGYQMSKLLVPSVGAGLGQSAWSGIWSSFGDAPGGFREESKELIHQIGFETRLETNSSFMLALRTGTFLESKTHGGRRYSTVGLGVGFHGFEFNMAYLLAYQNNHPLQNTLRFGLNFLMVKNQQES